MNREGLRWLILHANRRPANSNSAVESAQRSDHPWQARQQGGGWTINQYRPSRSVHPPWRPASPPGVTNPFLSPRSVPKVRVSAERRCATEPRARAKVSSNGVELVLACAPKPAENAVPAQGRPGRTARPSIRDIANDRRLAAWPACASDADDGVAFRQANRHVWLVDAMSPEYLHIESSGMGLVSERLGSSSGLCGYGPHHGVFGEADQACGSGA